MLQKSMLLTFLLPLLGLLFPTYLGTHIQLINLSPSLLPVHSSFSRELSAERDGRVLFAVSISPSVTNIRRRFRNPLDSSMVPVASPTSRGPVASPNRTPWHRGRHHRHPARGKTISPFPSKSPGCGQICAEPFTSAPFGSTCGCVLPMKIRLILDVSLYLFFPLVSQLEIEIANGIYLEQKQVVIVGAKADSQDQEKSVVDVNLVSFEERFDNTTALLIYERFWQKKVALNSSLFGNYKVIHITYPGLPSSPPSGESTGEGPSGSRGDQQFPISAYVDEKNEKFSPRLVLVISLSVLVLLLACCGALVAFLKYKKLGQPSNAVGPVSSPSLNKRSGKGPILSTGPASSPAASVLTTMPATVISVKMFSLTELKRATNKFSSERILGEGGFGRVYHGVVEGGSAVAVKLLTRNQQHGDREFISEVEMLSRLHHRNLVKLIGICIEESTRCLVYELVTNGSVESHLHENKKGSLDWDARLKIALGAARGLAYLHEDSNPRVIHRDFKASNVLLEDDFTPKVSDFGLAREATEGSHHISTRVMGTFGYVAPEYAMTGHLLVKSDVYSYGVVLLELLSGRKPVDMSQPPGQENLVTWARPLFSTREGLEELVDPSLSGGTYDFDDMAKVAAIASMCVHPEVTERPFMGEVVQALKLIYKDTDETCGDNYSKRESSVLDSDKGGFAPSDSSWWNAVEGTPRLVHGHASTFITMDYSSGPLEDMENRYISVSSLVGGGVAFPVEHNGNRSGPLRTVRSKKAFYRLKGSMSEHGLLSKPAWDGGDGPSAYEASF